MYDDEQKEEKKCSAMKYVCIVLLVLILVGVLLGIVYTKKSVKGKIVGGGGCGCSAPTIASR